jgi:phosphatidylserine/phosphatidylglycerophosphate/cardiolipin synthase-like enzyme
MSFDKETPVSNLPPEAVYTDSQAIYNLSLDLINSAKKSIYIEQAEFNDARIIELLIQKAREGLEVKILLDQWQRVNQTTLEELKARNISVQYYPARKGQYQRVKLLVVDQEQAVVYCSSWTEADFSAHIVVLKLTGKAAWKAASIFTKDWEFTTTLSVDIPKISTLPEDNITLAANANVKQQIIKQIESSTSTIWVETSLVSETDTVQALIDAADKGRNVRLLLDPAEAEANPQTIEKLTSHNIQIRYYSAELPCHVNIGLFDGKSFVISSSPWTYSAFVINHELSVTVPSAAASQKLVEFFNHDWNASK